jgi:Lon protease-like protein
MSQREKKLPEILPVLPLKDTVIFPRMIMPLMMFTGSELLGRLSN